MRSYVYTITFPLGLLYVGKANDPEARWAAHRSTALNGSRLPVHQALRKYGDLAVFDVVFSALDEVSAFLVERELIAEAQQSEMFCLNSNAGQTRGGMRPRAVRTLPEPTPQPAPPVPARLPTISCKYLRAANAYIREREHFTVRDDPREHDWALAGVVWASEQSFATVSRRQNYRCLRCKRPHGPGKLIHDPEIKDANVIGIFCENCS